MSRRRPSPAHKCREDVVIACYIMPCVPSRAPHKRLPLDLAHVIADESGGANLTDKTAAPQIQIEAAAERPIFELVTRKESKKYLT
jgi:hypothetical protein